MGTMGELHEVLGHVFAGRLKPVVDRTFPLSEIRAAHEYLEKSRMFGKVVLMLDAKAVSRSSSDASCSLPVLLWFRIFP